MRCRIVLIAPSVANCPTMHKAFQLASTSRNMRGIGSVLPPVVAVFCQSYESCGRVGWRGPDARWERVLPVCLPNTIPSHARSLLRGILLLRPAARRRSAFPVPSRTSLRTAAKNAAQTSSGLRPIKHSLALGSIGPLRLLSDPSKFGNSKRRHHHGNEPRNSHRQPRQ